MDRSIDKTILDGWIFRSLADRHAGRHIDRSAKQPHVQLIWAALEAMYATIGYIVPEYYKFPGYLSPSLGLKFSDVPNGLAALSKCRPYEGDAGDIHRTVA